MSLCGMGNYIPMCNEGFLVPTEEAGFDAVQIFRANEGGSVRPEEKFIINTSECESEACNPLSC